MIVDVDQFAHAARHGTNALVTLMLSRPLIMILEPPPSSIHTHILLTRRDNNLNTPLHHASAFGRLKTLRILVSAGADPLARNSQRWSPLDYSATVQAEVYLRGLMREIDVVREKDSDIGKYNDGRLGVRLVHNGGSDGTVTEDQPRA